MTRSNCLIFALRKLRTHGGYLIVRRSRYRWLPHFLWAPPGGLDHAELEHYVPVRPGVGPQWQIWRGLVFRGRVRRCDRVECARDCCPCPQNRDQPDDA